MSRDMLGPKNMPTQRVNATKIFGFVLQKTISKFSKLHSHFLTYSLSKTETAHLM